MICTSATSSAMASTLSRPRQRLQSSFASSLISSMAIVICALSPNASSAARQILSPDPPPLAHRSASISRCWFSIRSAAAGANTLRHGSRLISFIGQSSSQSRPGSAQHRSAVTISSLVMSLLLLSRKFFKNARLERRLHIYPPCKAYGTNMISSPISIGHLLKTAWCRRPRLPQASPAPERDHRAWRPAGPVWPWPDRKICASGPDHPARP